jgi:hypothetical protein
MKKLLLMMCFSILLTQAYAQKESQELKTNIDEMLVNIDKSTFTSGILYDRVTDWAGLDSFNDDAKNVSNSKHFEQALHELYKASNQQKFTYYRNLRKKYTKSKQQDIVDIGILNASFHQLNYNQENESKGGLRIKGEKFEGIEGKSPFVEKHLFLVSPLKGYVKGQTITYNFDDSFLFDITTTKKMVSLTIDFGTNKKHLVFKDGTLINKSIEISYSESGNKELICTAVYADGTQQTTKGKVHVKVLQATMMRGPIADGTDDDIHNSTLAFQGYDETSSIYGQLEYRIFYHEDSNGNYERRLLKPIVIIDGFDPLDQRKIQDSDDHPNSSDEEHGSIEEMMIYKDSYGVEKQIIKELRKPENGGYDVIIVNHPTYTRGTKTIDGGADYIERNGLAHASFYQYLNTTILANGSSEELVIAGPSMGGQISRYALSYMEKKYEETNNAQWEHRVRLWVSIDSPHLGANISLGVQTLLNLINDETDSVGASDFVDYFLGSVAAKQQLIEQYKSASSSVLNEDYLNAKTVSQGYSENRGHPFFTQFYDNLYTNGLSGSRGYPQNLRKIALINGSLTGSDKLINPFTPLWVTETNTPYADSFADDGELALQIKGYANYIGHITTLESNYMPAYFATRRRVAFFKSKRGVNWESHYRYVSNNNVRGNMDNIPGGWFSTQKDVAASVVSESSSETIWGDLGWTISVNNWRILDLDHTNSFIPTVSSLGFKNPNFRWNEPIDTSLLCNDEIPFDTFFAPKDNERHTSFTETSVNWLFQELAGNEQSIPNYSKPAITGDPEVYTGQTVIYTMPKVVKATSYTWDLDFNYPFSDNGPSPSYTPWTIISGQGTNKITVRAGSPIIGYISCRPRSSCGAGRMSYIAVRSYNSSGGGGGGGGGDDNPCDDNYRFLISPNPSKGNVLTLRIELPDDPCDDDINPYRHQIKNTVEIYDIYGSKKHSRVYNSNDISITGLRLKMGVYVVHLTNVNGVKKEKKLMIE